MKFVSSPIESRGITPEQQVSILDKRLGKGVGAKRERARLAVKIVQLAEQKAIEEAKKLERKSRKMAGKTPPK